MEGVTFCSTLKANALQTSPKMPFRNVADTLGIPSAQTIKITTRNEGGKHAERPVQTEYLVEEQGPPRGCVFR